LFSRSSGLVDQIFLPVQHREGGEGEQVVLGFAEHGLDLGQLLAQHRGDDLELLVHVLGVGLGEDGADRGGGHLLVALGDHRQHVAHEVDPDDRCHAAPMSTEPMAAFSPVWASEMTSCTPPSPRAFRPRRNAVQNAPSSLSPTSKPSTSRLPSAVTPVAITTAWDTTRRFTRALQ
jgi:hypothetical protein